MADQVAVAECSDLEICCRPAVAAAAAAAAADYWHLVHQKARSSAEVAVAAVERQYLVQRMVKSFAEAVAAELQVLQILNLLTAAAKAFQTTSLPTEVAVAAVE